MPPALSWRRFLSFHSRLGECEKGKECLLIRLVCCAVHKLIRGSKPERPASALLSNFHTEALSWDVASFVTSALASRSQSNLVRESLCFFLPLHMTHLRVLGLFIKKTRLNYSGSCHFDACEATEGEAEKCICGLGSILASCFPRKQGRSAIT